MMKMYHRIKSISFYAVLEMKILIYCSESNSWIDLYIKIKTEKLTAPNKFLLVLGRRTGTHCEDCLCDIIYYCSITLAPPSY